MNTWDPISKQKIFFYRQKHYLKENIYQNDIVNSQIIIFVNIVIKYAI